MKEEISIENMMRTINFIRESQEHAEKIRKELGWDDRIKQLQESFISIRSPVTLNDIGHYAIDEINDTRNEFYALMDASSVEYHSQKLIEIARAKAKPIVHKTQGYTIVVVPSA